MTALARAGWRTLSLAEFAGGRGADAPTGNVFLLTFDDGYASLAEHAYPVLADLGFTATTFLITDYVGKTNTWDVRYTWSRLPHLGWADVERWHARGRPGGGGGFEFASHGATHRRLPWLDDAGIALELGRSRDVLRTRLGPDAGTAIAYPFGAVDARVIRLAREAGYALGFGGVKGNGDSLHQSRVPVYSWDLGRTPFGLRDDAIGELGRAVAHFANRCAVGTSVMLMAKQRISRQPESAVGAGS